MESNQHVSTNILPGMTCNGIEFFKDQEQRLQIVHGGRIKPFNEAPYAVIQMLQDVLHREIETNSILKEWFPESNMAKLEKFAWCRFGGLDFEADIKDNRLQDGEYHGCPNRGNCAGEGIICKLPVYEGKRLTTKMIRLIKLLSGTDTNEVIAMKMDIALGSLHESKKRLYKHLGVQTKQEVAIIAHRLNLV